MTMDQALPTVEEPFPISLISDRYLLFDINAITYARREHHICGVLIGSLPQIPQQNVFLGVPLELMPEEARILVSKGAAYIVDDVREHADGLSGVSGEERQAFLTALEKEGREAAKEAEKKAEGKKAKALKKLQVDQDSQKAARAESLRREPNLGSDCVDEEPTLFSAGPPRPGSPASSHTTAATDRPSQIYQITPTTSCPPLKARRRSPALALPQVPNSYPLFVHLHARGYFISPGLRFGCQYLVYPGDPLRFHSHFLAVGASWDEDIDLLDLVGGGRLGTGVKKGFLLGGKDEKRNDDHQPEREAQTDNVRSFCIEWSGM